MCRTNFAVAPLRSEILRGATHSLTKISKTGLMIGATCLALIAPPAMSAPSEKAVDKRSRAALRESRLLDNGQLQLVYGVSGAELKNTRQNADKAGPDASKRIQAHIQQAMRSGRNLDLLSVDVATVEVEGTADVYVVQDKTDEALDLEVIKTENGSDGFDLGVKYAVVNTDSNSQTVPGAQGFDAGSSSNMTLRGRGTRTVFFNPAYPSQNNVDHWVTTTWEKWQSNSNSRDWAYNRYATFDPANPASGYSISMRDATIRSRPWQGYESRVTGGPYNYTPRPTETCTTTNITLNVGNVASLTIPSVNCSAEMEIYPNGNLHSMGTAWYGSTTSQKYLDFAFSLASNGNTPIYADYVWMQVRHCYGWSCPNNYYIWTDSGW